MSLVIGLDTGGTYTDAALLDAASGQVLATGKALTTREDLSIGLGGAIASRAARVGRRRSALARVRSVSPSASTPP